MEAAERLIDEGETGVGGPEEERIVIPTNGAIEGGEFGRRQILGSVFGIESGLYNYSRRCDAQIVSSCRAQEYPTGMVVVVVRCAGEPRKTKDKVYLQVEVLADDETPSVLSIIIKFGLAGTNSQSICPIPDTTVPAMAKRFCRVG